MKISIKKIEEIDIQYVYVELPIMYGNEDMDYDFPLRVKNIWKGTIEIETGKILEWPEDKSEELFLKVVDMGIYRLLDKNMNIVLSIVEDYVPNRLLPPTNGYGDYVNFKIKNGVIKNWYKNPSVEQFISSFEE